MQETHQEYDATTGALIAENTVGSSDTTAADPTQAVTVDPAALAALRARLEKTTGTTAAVLRDLLDTLAPE